MNEAFPAPMRAWLERSPKRQRAIKRLSADLDALVARLESAVPAHVRDAIAARIDPPRDTSTPTPDIEPALPEGQSAEPPRTAL